MTAPGALLALEGIDGSGKSTLVNCIVTEFRRRNLKVAVVAIDPSSSISGGALLGDRIRMRSHAEDKGVFIRSMATRGHLGGLNKTAREAVLVFDAMGFDIIVIETVGVGQDEVEIAQLAHTTAVVSLPATGDGIQAMKAGLMEIADIFVVNKKDLPGADRKVTEINAMLDIDPIERAWRPPVLLTNCRTGEGVLEVIEKIQAHLQYLKESGLLETKGLQRSRDELHDLMRYKLTRELYQKLEGRPEYKAAIKKIAARKEDPYTVAERLIAEFLFSESR